MTMVLQPWFLFLAAIMVTALAVRLKTEVPVNASTISSSDLADFKFRKQIVKKLTVDKFFREKPNLCTGDAVAESAVLNKLDAEEIAYDFGPYRDFLDDVIGHNRVKSYELWSAGAFIQEDQEEVSRNQMASQKLPGEIFNYGGQHVHNWYMIEMASGKFFTLDDQFFSYSADKHKLFSPYLDSEPAEGLIDERLRYDLGKPNSAELTKEDWRKLENLQVDIGTELAQLGSKGAEMYFGHTRIEIVYGVRAFRSRSEAMVGMARYYSGGITDRPASKSLHARSYVFKDDPPTFCHVVNSMREVMKHFDARGGTDFEDQGASSATQVRLLHDRSPSTFQNDLFDRYYPITIKYLKPSKWPHGLSVSCRTLYWQTVRSLGEQGEASIGPGLLEQISIVANLAKKVSGEAIHLAKESLQLPEEASRLKLFGVASVMAFRAVGYMVKAGQDIDDPPSDVRDAMSKGVELVDTTLKMIEEMWLQMRPTQDVAS